jgi:hypothetical protein
MKHLKKLLIAFWLLVIVLSIKAQTTIPATGGDATGAGGSSSFSVGQMVYTTNTGTNGSVAEGVQQPYEISVLVGIEQAGFTNFYCSVYPNPATDLLTLETETSDNENLIYQLYDMMGKLLLSERLIDIKTSISMANLAPSTYFLKVTDNQNVSKIFKVVKTK